MRVAKIVALLFGAMLVVGCMNNEAYIRALRGAMADSSITLVDAVTTAETEVGGARCLRASLIVSGDTPVFAIGVIANGELTDVRVDPPTGEVISADAKSAYNGALCEDAISMSLALQIAEERAGGVAVAAVPDDDVDCAREIQVLEGSNLWEVKVGSDGRVIEFEESDEDGSGD